MTDSGVVRTVGGATRVQFHRVPGETCASPVKLHMGSASFPWEVPPFRAHFDVRRTTYSPEAEPRIGLGNRVVQRHDAAGEVAPLGRCPACGGDAVSETLLVGPSSDRFGEVDVRIG